MSHVFRIESDPALEFWRDRAAQSLLTAPVTFRNLAGLGTLVRPLNIGRSVYAPTANVALGNGNGALNDFFNSPPLGVTARIIGADGELFAGTITRVSMGAEIQISIEGGLGVPLTATVPLRNTSEWGEYQDTRALPYGYGKQTSEPIAYNQQRTIFVVSAGKIAGVDAVRRDNVAVAFESRSGLDKAGLPVQFIELTSPLQDGERLECDWRGRLHPISGELLSNPAEIMWDFLSNICGFDVSLSDLGRFRADTLSRGIEIAPFFDNDTLTIQSAIALMCQNSGAAWSLGMTGIAKRYPATRDDEPISAELGQLTSSRPSALSALSDVITVLQVDFNFDQAKRRYRSSLTLQAPRAIERYGERKARIEFPAVTSSRTALTLADDWLQQFARPVWRLSLESSRAPALALNPGDWITYTDASSPLNGIELLVTETAANLSANSVNVTAEGSADPGPATELVRLSEAIAPLLLESAAVITQPNIAEFTLSDENGNPLAGAKVTVDETRIFYADQNGRVQITPIEPGPHTSVIEVADRDPQYFGWTQP